MTEAILPFRILEAQVHPSRLEVFEIRAARDFEISILSGRPHFQVVSLSRTKPEISRAKLNHAVVQAQRLQDPLGVRRQRLMLVIGSLRRGDLHHLNFVELMNANDPARLASCRSSFTPETRRV